MRVIDWDHPVIYLMFPWGMKITAPYFYDVKSDLWVGTFFYRNYIWSFSQEFY